MAFVETFVVRIFVPADRGFVPLAGTVEHVGAGRASSFSGIVELLDLVLRELQIDHTYRPSTEEEQ